MKNLINYFKRIFESNKKFEISSMQSPNFPMKNRKIRLENVVEGDWAKQKNANSCGYNLIHNSQPYLKMTNYEGSPHLALNTINEIRAQKGKKSLNLSDNLKDVDLTDYFRKKGMDLMIYHDKSAYESYLKPVLCSREFDLIYMNSNYHYTGIVKSNEGHFLYLDSLLESPKEISFEDVEKKILESLGIVNERSNFVAIVKNPLNKKKFIINN